MAKEKITHPEQKILRKTTDRSLESRYNYFIKGSEDSTVKKFGITRKKKGKKK